MSPLRSDRVHSIGVVLEAVVTLSRELAAARATPFGDMRLTRTQLQILFILAHSQQPVTPGTLAAALKMTRGAITQSMDQLREHRLAEQSTYGHDGRVRVWRLTTVAGETVAAFERAAIERATPWFAELSTDELHHLATLIGKVEAT